MRIVSRRFGILISAGLVAMLVATAGLAAGYVHFSRDLPDHARLAEAMSRAHAVDGTLVTGHATEPRPHLPFEAIPAPLINAFLSAEDRNFFRHNGIDPQAMVRAAFTNLGSGATQGASTITQQVAKNALLTSERTMDRKIRQALIALRMEQAFTKEEILELYLNEVFLGTPTPDRDLYGVAAAALEYFDKSVHELTLAEMAYLAALPKGPNDYHPIRHERAAIGRRNWVLDRMVANGFVTREDAEEAKAEPLTVTARWISP